ncbi:MAG TPA: amino acid permease [Steroidobacteraceae bacterium]|nr:amino acid permease [Steroidobacteraceae bacterium]
MQTEFDRGELKRTLGPIHLVLFGIGCIIGAGIFVRTGTAAAQYAGPAVILSFVIAGAVCALAGLCYAELASMLPVSGSAYTYSYTTVGEFGAWIMGALLLLEYALAASVVAVGWSGYAVSLMHDIGWDIPAAMTQPHGKMVVAALSQIALTDPSVALNGVTAKLADGSLVQFFSNGTGVITGNFTASIAQYDVLNAAKDGGFALTNSLDILVNSDTQATLAAATKVLDPATSGLRELAAGTVVNVPAHSIVQLPSASIVPIAASAVVPALFNLPAVFITLACTGLLILGVSESATVNNIIVAIKVFVILLFIGVGAFFINPANWHPFIPAPTGVENQFGWDGIIRAATIVFFAYIGFEAVSTAGQEAKNPRKDMPIGILGSLIVCTILYMLTAAVLTGVVSFTKLNVAAPVATAVDTFGPQWGWLAKLIKIGAIAGLSSVVLVLMFGQTRVFYSMSRDGLLPPVLGKVHPKFKTPWINTLIVGVVVSLAAAVFDINYLGDMTSVGTLVAFGLVCFSVIWLRQKRPDLPRHFRVPLYPVLPAVGVLACFVLAWIGVEAHIRWFFFKFLIGAIAIYFIYGYWASPLRRKEAG